MIITFLVPHIVHEVIGNKAITKVRVQFIQENKARCRDEHLTLHRFRTN